MQERSGAQSGAKRRLTHLLGEPMPIQTVYWYQKDSHLVDSWEFQYRLIGTDEWGWVPYADEAHPWSECQGCFQAQMDLPEDHVILRARAVSEVETSLWSDDLAVYLPEPDLGAALCAAILFILALFAVKMKIHY